MKKTLEKIVFFGNEKLATGIAAPKPVVLDALKRAGLNVEKVVAGKLSELGEHQSKLAVLAAYGQIIPQKVLDEFPLGIINIHPSLLPAYRGPTPIEQAILDNAPKTGVSIMKLTSEMDAGPIYKQKTLHLTGKESKAELSEKLQQLGAELLLEVLPGIATNKLKPRRQPHPDRASYCSKLDKTNGRINWNKPAVQLAREIRAFLGWPGSYTKLGGIDIIITQANVVEQSAQAGEIKIRDKQLLVFCGQDALEIQRLKPAGKNEMDAEAFLAGYKDRLNK